MSKTNHIAIFINVPQMDIKYANQVFCIDETGVKEIKNRYTDPEVTVPLRGHYYKWVEDSEYYIVLYIGDGSGLIIESTIDDNNFKIGSRIEFTDARFFTHLGDIKEVIGE